MPAEPAHLSQRSNRLSRPGSISPVYTAATVGARHAVLRLRPASTGRPRGAAQPWHCGRDQSDRQSGRVGQNEGEQAMECKDGVRRSDISVGRDDLAPPDAKRWATDRIFDLRRCGPTAPSILPRARYLRCLFMQLRCLSASDPIFDGREPVALRIEGERHRPGQAGQRVVAPTLRDRLKRLGPTAQASP